MRIACLHTAAGNAALFEAAADGLGVALIHEVRPELLAAAESGPVPLTETAALLATLAGASDGVLLTCSTCGPAVELAASSKPVLRADALLARQAGPGSLVLYAAPTTEESTRALFAGADVCLVPEAWDEFKAGRFDAYFDTVARAAEAGFAAGWNCIALAQASMAPAAERCRYGLPLTVPRVALVGMVEVLSR